MKFGKAISVALIISAFNIFAQSVDLNYYYSNSVEFDKSIPSPEEFFGFQIGDWHLYPGQLTAYLKEVAEKSDKVQFIIYGKTYEQRPLVQLIISSKENLGNLETIRQKHLQRIDPESGADNFDNPVVVWMGYSVHGNEPSGSNSVPLFVYYLAAAKDPKIDSWLKNAVILIDANINPDGLSRFAQWANSNKGAVPSPDPNHREHREFWPSGRTNHYWFDLNRDWLPVQHPESKARLKLYHMWEPNIVTDHHEMGSNSTFFFQPGILSRTNPNTPAAAFELTEKITRYHAAALDSIGSLYFAKQTFDDFYYGKGSTYPDVNGSIGILFEQASSRGHVQNTQHGVMPFSFTIKNQLNASFATLKAGVELRHELFEYQREFFKKSIDEADETGNTAFVFSSSDKARSAALVDILLNHSIEVFHLGKKLKIDEKNFESDNSFVIPFNQPRYKLINAMFEKRTEFEDSVFYDISAWSLDKAFAMQSADFSGNTGAILGEKIEANLKFFDQFQRVENAYAYLFEWDQFFAPRALYRLLKHGVIAKYAMSEFSIKTFSGTQKFKAGSITIPLIIQKDKISLIEDLLQEAAEMDGINVSAVNSGYSTEGILLGSGSMRNVIPPKVLMITGERISTSDVSEIWHMLDYRFNIDVTLADLRYLSNLNINNYNTLILPGGSYSRIGTSMIESLKKWVSAGGKIISLGSSIRWLNDNKIVSVEFVEPKEAGSKRRAYSDRSNDWGANSLAGTIFNSEIDLTNPVCFGYEKDHLAMFKRNRIFVKPSNDPYSTPAIYTDDPLIAGFASDKNLQQIKNAAAILTLRHGRGSVIYLDDSVNFRSFWYGGNKLFLNALLFRP